MSIDASLLQSRRRGNLLWGVRKKSPFSLDCNNKKVVLFRSSSDNADDGNYEESKIL
jgi:hypothetical protein